MTGSKYISKRKTRPVQLQVERLEAREVLATATPTTPLNDLGTASYNRQQGGLYPNGADVRPAALETAAESRAAQIAPLDANGNVDRTNGKIVLISVGMSNASAEFDGGSNSFEPRANADASKNSQLVIVNGAQSGRDAGDWADAGSSAWNTLNDRLAGAGVSAKQVQVAWIKEAERDPSQYGGFVPAAQKLQSDLEAIARNLKTRFPNITIAYISSRTHAFTTTGLNPEPYAYESGFSVKWTIQDQINGKGNVNYDPGKGAVTAPLLSWGPYLWANGTSARSDGFTWTTADVESDQTHPSASGVGKVADMLLAFFKTDPTATPWFLRSTPAGAGPTVSASADRTSGNSGLVVHFSASATATSAASIAQYAWTYDDGDFAYGTNPTKTFYAPGTYHVHLAVTDTLGNVTLNTIAITVNGKKGSASGDVLTSDLAPASPIPSPSSTPPAWANLPGLGLTSRDGFQMAAPTDWMARRLLPPRQAAANDRSPVLKEPASAIASDRGRLRPAHSMHPGGEAPHAGPWLAAVPPALDPAQQLR